MRAEFERHPVDALTNLIHEPHEIAGSPEGVFVSNVAPVDQADERSLTWLRSDLSDRQKRLEATRATVVICDETLELTPAIAGDKVLIKVENPKLAFAQVVRALFAEEPEPGIHPTAVVAAQATIAPDASIGPFTVVGRAEIGAGTIISGSTFIADDVRIGRNVVIAAGCVIGETGYNLARDSQGVLHGLPHLGGVVIEDDVEIQAATVIDRGVLDDTVIGQGTKIDSGCFIAHNCRIGRHNVIIAHTLLSGSVTTGDGCWFGPATVVRDGITVGAGSFVGMGSLVVESLTEESRVMGSPARPVDEVKASHDILRRLVADEDR